MTRRPIPARAMLDRVTIEPCTGYTARGPVYGTPIEGVRANLNVARRNGGQQTSLDSAVGALTFVRDLDVLLDDVDVPLLSALTNEATGNRIGVIGLQQRFDQPPLQAFVLVGIGRVL